jgi:hypothetical protein
VLKTVPVEQLQDKHFSIQGDSVSPNEIVKLWEQKHNVSLSPRSCLSQTDKPSQDKLQVEYRPVKELDDRVAADANDFLAVLLQEWASGRGQLKGLSNEFYPEWKPAPVESVL